MLCSIKCHSVNDLSGIETLKSKECTRVVKFFCSRLYVSRRTPNLDQANHSRIGQHIKGLRRELSSSAIAFGNVFTNVKFIVLKPVAQAVSQLS